MKSRVRSVVWSALALAALAAAVVYVVVPAPVAVDVESIRSGPLRVTVDEEGRTRIRERYDVSAPLSGRVARCELHAGDAVLAGRSVVATLEPTDPRLLDPREVAEARAREKAAEATRELAGPALERARAAWDFAKTELARDRRLFDEQTLSRRELDASEQRELLAAQDFAAAQFSEQIANWELELARAALLRATPDADAGAEGWRLSIVAPIDGRVLRVFQESATIVAAGAKLIELGDPGDLEVEIEMLSTDAVKVRPGAEVLLDRWGGSEPLHARVRLIEPAAFTKISALGVEEQRTLVLADFVGPPAGRAALGDAYRVEAHVVVWEATSVLLVPVSALFRQAGAWSVFVAADGRARLRKVEIGQRGAREAEVLAGLAEGERVVAWPSDRVAEGVRVRAR
jgi:HlyD family secretion protein